MTDGGQILGPLVMGALADAVDLSTPFLFGATLLLVAAWAGSPPGSSDLSIDVSIGDGHAAADAPVDQAAAQARRPRHPDKRGTP
jgi:hypothetical protein